MARRGRLVPDLGISAPSVVARMVVWARDATDFRPSRNGVGGACASRRTVCESSRQRWRDRAGVYWTSRFRPRRSLHAYWRGRETRPIFDHRETGSAVLARAGARSARAAESDGATGQAFTGPRDFGPVGHCTHIGVGARRDRFSTIDKRRCDCCAGRAQAGSVSASDGATGQAVCRLPRFGKLALQLAPVACTHECNSHLCTLMTPQTVRDSSKDCFHGQFWRLTREGRARATCCAYKHPIGHVHLVATNLDPWH